MGDSPGLRGSAAARLTASSFSSAPENHFANADPLRRSPLDSNPGTRYEQPAEPATYLLSDVSRIPTFMHDSVWSRASPFRARDLPQPESLGP